MNGARREAVFRSILEAIGETPLVELRRMGAGLPGRVLAKLEGMNPGGSVKDRVALAMVLDAERSGRLRPGGTIVELTSGNTGIGLAMVAAVRGYRFIAVMSEGNSVERRRALEAYGARVELVPQAPSGRPGEVSGDDLRLVEERARALTAELGAFRPDQFGNPANAAVHETVTADEIWRQAAGRVDYWVAAVGTAGSFTGVARRLRSLSPSVTCVAVEPVTARVLAGIPVADPRHRLQGTGYASVPPLWDPKLCDACVGVSDEEAETAARRLAREEGILTGYSGGANVHAALTLAAEVPRGAVIVTLCPDTGLRYFSTGLY